MKLLLTLTALGFGASVLTQAAVINLADGSWNYNYNTNGADLSVSSGTLTSTGGSNADRSMWQYFSNQTLVDGGNISVSFTVSLTTSATTQGRGFSVGLFNSFDTEQTGVVGGVGGSDMMDDAGYLQSFGLGGNTTDRIESFYGQATNRAAPISNNGSGMTTIADTNYSSINDTNTHDVVLTIKRNGSAYQISSTLDGSAAGSSLIAASTLASDASYAGTDDFTFDMIAFGVKNSAQDLEISNIVLSTAVPEPSTYALILGLFGFAVIARKRLKK